MIAPEADPSRVRLAGPQDEEELFTLATNLHTENAIYRMNPDKVRAEIRASLSGQTDNAGNDVPQQGIIGIVGQRVIEGAAWLVYMQDWYTDDYSLQERFIHVKPEYRRSTNAKDLLAWAKRVAVHTCPLHIGIFSNERTEAKIRLYRKQLGEPVGAFWLFGATTGFTNKANGHGK